MARKKTDQNDVLDPLLPVANAIWHRVRPLVDGAENVSFDEVVLNPAGPIYRALFDAARAAIEVYYPLEQDEIYRQRMRAFFARIESNLATMGAPELDALGRLIDMPRYRIQRTQT